MTLLVHDTLGRIGKSINLCRLYLVPFSISECEEYEGNTARGKAKRLPVGDVGYRQDRPSHTQLSDKIPAALD